MSNYRQVWLQALPFQQFHVLFDSLSKVLSSFDHSTCALSVSGQYLALEEIYLPFRAAFPNNSTRRRGFTWRTPLAKDGVLTLSDMPFQALRPWPTPKHPLQITIRTLKEPDFKFE